MPQMFPSLWLPLFIFSTMIMLTLCSHMYFHKMKTNFTLNKNNTNYNTQKNWKW